MDYTTRHLSLGCCSADDFLLCRELQVTPVSRFGLWLVESLQVDGWVASRSWADPNPLLPKEESSGW